MKRRLIIIGAGGHGRSVAEVIFSSDMYQLVGFLDDSFPKLANIWDTPVLGRVADLSQWRGVAEFAIVAIGDNSLRRSVTSQLRRAGFSLATVVHPRAIISPTALIGDGSAIMAGAVVGTEATLGEGVIVNCAAVVDHHCRVSDFGHLGVGAVMAGGSVLETAAWIQAGAALGYGVKIEEGCILPPGAGMSQC